MLTINYFASIREALNQSQDKLELPDSVRTVNQLIDYLGASDRNKLAILTQDDKVLVAVNQTIVSRDYGLRGDEEIAFFPPMTGG